MDYLNSGQEDPEGHFMTVGPVEGVAAVFAPTRLAIVATQHCHVSSSDQEQAALSHSLNSTVQQLGGRAVGVQVHSVIGLPHQGSSALLALYSNSV